MPSRLRALSTGGAALVAVAVAATAPAPASAQWKVETNSLHIKEPTSIAGDFDAAIGDFGVPLYGATLVGEVQVVESADKGCKPYPAKLAPGASGLPIIALVDRGDCYFIEKAFNAEKAGAAAVIVADYKDERLLTMAAPDDRPEIARLQDDITIPTALVTMATGAKLRKAAAGASKSKGSGVVVELDWKDAVTNPDDRVEWELWTTADTGCGPSCDRQTAFKKAVKTQAAALERGKYTAFTPRFVTRRCADGTPAAECAQSCIHRGRYCAWAPVADKHKRSFSGKDVVIEAKRQLCAHEAAAGGAKPWAWWDYAAASAESCTMDNGKFGSAACAAPLLKDAGIDPDTVEKCVGDTDADADPPVLAKNAAAQGYKSGGGGASSVLLLPTVTINGAQYRGRLDVSSLLRGLCAGFSELAEPPECLAGGMEVNECASADNGGCWSNSEFTACVDTFRGRKCQCPYGFKGDGFSCTDVRSDVSAAGGAGGGRGGRSSLGVAGFFGVMGAAAVVAAVAGVVAHRYKAQVEMRREVEAILKQYMPLDGGEMGMGGGGGGGSGGGGGGGIAAAVGFGTGAAMAAHAVAQAVVPPPPAPFTGEAGDPLAPLTGGEQA